MDLYLDFSTYAGVPQVIQKKVHKIISDKANDVSFRVLQIMSNFFVRIGKKDKASELISRYYGSSNIKIHMIV